jgi:hypothetical protein
MISLVICLATLLIVSHVSQFLMHGNILSHLIYSFQAAKIPSADDIEDYNDPVLREVFASSRKNRPTGGDVEQLPQLTRNWSSTQTVTSEYPVKSASVPSISTYRPVQQPGNKIFRLFIAKNSEKNLN